MFENSIISLNKPLGWTSFDVVAYSRNKLQIKKIGHCGTLDPLATGLLLLATNKATKKIESLQNLSKTYIATFCLGATTQSFDTEFWPEKFEDTSHINPEQIKSIISKNFLGVIEQIPPQYSAISVNGKKAYKSARKGEEIQIPSREVEIIKFDVIELKLISPDELPYQASKLVPYQKNPHLVVEQKVLDTQKSFKLVIFKVQIICSKGTYIRSLIRDLATHLRTVGYMISLERTAIGTYLLSDALELKELVVSS